MTTANGPDEEGVAGGGAMAAGLALSVWCSCIQTKDAIISNKPERARMFRSFFTCDPWTMIFPHIFNREARDVILCLTVNDTGLPSRRHAQAMRLRFRQRRVAPVDVS